MKVRCKFFFQLNTLFWRPVFGSEQQSKTLIANYGIVYKYGMLSICSYDIMNQRPYDITTLDNSCHIELSDLSGAVIY